MLLGPILGVENDELYTCCIIAADSYDAHWTLKYQGRKVKFVRLDGWDGASIYRAEMPLSMPEQGDFVSYEIFFDGQLSQDLHGRHEWRFYVPGKNETPRISYASCNGFHHPKRYNHHDVELWKDLLEKHAQEPFSLMLMGGDQIYADSLYHSPLAKPLLAWPKLTNAEKASFVISDKTREALEHFYLHQYIETWGQPQISEALASIPSAMMWDDHDIIDGYGSYPVAVQKSPFMQQLFTIARRCFVALQLRGEQNHALLGGDAQLSWGLTFRQQLILAMDNRSERSLKTVMTPAHTQALKSWMAAHQDGQKPVWLMSAVPMLYFGFADIERRIGHVPYFKQWQDDLFDHWRAFWHLKERQKLLDWLAHEVKPQTSVLTILSGDVHVGAQAELECSQGIVNQLTSSAIVNKPPSWFASQLISMFADIREEQIGEDMLARNLRPFSGLKILRRKNYLMLKHDGEHWYATWVAKKKTYSARLL